MKASGFTSERIAMVLRQAQAVTRLPEIRQNVGGSELTFCASKKRFGRLGVLSGRGLRERASR